MATGLLQAKDYVAKPLRTIWEMFYAVPPPQDVIFPRLSSPHSTIKTRYDVVVVGSGYGGSIAACRCASAGQSVCVLERGKEWLPGEFPESVVQASDEMQLHLCGKKDQIGRPDSLYELHVSKNIIVAQGCGLGGGSLINANVGLDAEPAVFEVPQWPKELKEDMGNLMVLDRQHVVDMLLPTPYPDNYPPLHKMERMKDGLSGFDIEDIDKILYKTPLYVTFEDTSKNHVGVPQPKCTGCGNCVGGCNVGAKNTLNLNYLSEAKAHGAEIFTKVEVLAVTEESQSSDWLVHYKRLVKGSFEVEEEIIRAKHVILGAGSLGSTKLLLRSKQRGLNVSNQVGKCFSTNGDAFAFSFNGGERANSVGLKTKHSRESENVEPPGPCITSVMDFRKIERGNLKDHFIIEDGCMPSVLDEIFSNGLKLAARDILKPESIDKSLTFLCMGHDDASGVISYDDSNDSIDIDWDGVGVAKNFEIVNEAVEKVATGLGGKFVINPVWSEFFGRKIVAAHPLGGCPMGESGMTGVVNHAGQVFNGDSDKALDGLYIVDGAILPVAVGVNPTLTISCLAERCMRLLAQREGWYIDYSFKPLGEEAFSKRKPGISFTEKMIGTFFPSNDKGKETPCEFTVTIESDDIERMIKFDPNHTAEISGTVTCSELSTIPMTVSEGRLHLFSTSDKQEDTKEMVYKMVLTGNKNKIFSFHGVKTMHKDHFGEIGWTDTTVLFVNIYEGREFAGDPLGAATLYITLPNFAKQLATLEITHAQSIREKLHWQAQFGGFFARAIWDVYGPRVPVSNTHFKKDAEPRQKRRLQLNGCHPELYKVATKDEFELRLTRYNGGKKGPVVMFHGAGVSSGIFSLDTIDQNLLEYLVQHRYDVWLAEWRVSCNLPTMARRSYDFDDCANYDCPAIIDKVLEITKGENVQVIAHCVGSMIMFGSLLSGALERRKIRSMVISAAAAIPLSSQFNNLKAALRLSSVFDGIGIKGLENGETDDTFERLFNTFVKAAGRVLVPHDEQCDNSVCHRITFIYGRLWEHQNLNQLTHETLHEFFGYIAMMLMSHLSLNTRKGRLVSASGEDFYLPDIHKGLKSTAYRVHINRLDLPILFFSGEKNMCFEPEGLRTTMKLLQEAHPSQKYSVKLFPGYGHLDCFIGKNAIHDVYPCILETLENLSCILYPAVGIYHLKTIFTA